MASLLVLLLVVVIFCGAAFYLAQNAPEPMRKWLLMILIVVGAIIAIVWLTSGGLMGVHPGVPR